MEREVKYRKFPISFGERLSDIPDYQQWRQLGWTVKWSFTTVEDGKRYVETLLERTLGEGALTSDR
jgi:hypothetical protein